MLRNADEDKGEIAKLLDSSIISFLQKNSPVSAKFVHAVAIAFRMKIVVRDVRTVASVIHSHM